MTLLLLNKPYGVLCQFTDEGMGPKRPTLADYVPVPGVYPAGRLDADSEGLLLLTDDGALIHRLTHPKKHVDKVYEVSCARPVTEEQLAKLRAGVVLNDDPVPVRSEECEITGELTLRMMLTEGKYHQVKRMIAAVGNHEIGRAHV